MKFHEVRHLWVGLDFLSGLHSLFPRGTVPRWSFSPSFPGVPSVFGRMTSFLVTDEAFAIPDMFRSIAWGEIDLVHIHGVWVNL